MHSAFPGYKSVIRGVIDPERGEQEMMPAAETRESAACRRLRPEQSLYSLIQDQVSCLSQPGDFVVILFAGAFSAARAWLTVPRHWVFMDARRILDAPIWQKKTTLTQFGNAALRAGTSDELSGKSAWAAVMVASFVLEIRNTHPL